MTLLSKIAYDKIFMFCRDMSQIVEKCPVSQCFRIRQKNSWIRISMRMTSKM